MSWKAAACAISLVAFCSGCTQSGYAIFGESYRTEHGRVVAAGGDGGALARAGSGPVFAAKQLCEAPAQPQLLVELRAIENAPFLVPCGASDPLPQEESLRLPISPEAMQSIAQTQAGTCWSLRTETGAEGVNREAIPARLALCGRSSQPELVGVLYRRGAGQQYQLAAPISATGVRSRVTILEHGETDIEGVWSFIARTERQERIAVSYDLIEGRPLPLRVGAINRLHFAPPSEGPEGPGGVLIMKDPAGQLIFALNAGVEVSLELLDGLEVSADRRVAYTAFHIDSRACRTMREHRQLRVRSGAESYLFAPGTVSWLSHQGESFRFLALGAEVQLPNECSSIRLERVRWALTVGLPEGQGSTGQVP